MNTNKKVIPRRTWCVGELTVSLDDVLLNKIDYPLNLKNFQEFCHSEHNEENVNCWLEINNWKSTFDKTPNEVILQTAQDIIEKYIGINATVAQVNIAERTSRFLMSDEEETPRIDDRRFQFDATMLEIEDIIHRGIFPRFIQNVRGEVDNLRARELALWWLHLREMKSPADLFTFPAFINEAESRLHSYVATTQMIIFLLVGWFTPYWQCYCYVLYGYTMRVITGPRFCPSAWLVLFVLYPIANKYKLFKNEMVPSSPKRVAQIIGILFSLLYIILMNFSPLAARVISIVHITLSFLAASTGFCLSCYLHHYLIDLKYRCFSTTPVITGGYLLTGSGKQPNRVLLGLSQHSVLPEQSNGVPATIIIPPLAIAALSPTAPPRSSSPRGVVLGFNEIGLSNKGLNEQQGLVELGLAKPCVWDQEQSLTDQSSFSRKTTIAPHPSPK